MKVVYKTIVQLIGIYKFIENSILSLFQSQTEAYVKSVYKLFGLKMDGENPWDLKVYNKKFFARVASQPSLGLGESYMDGWWDSEDLGELFYRMLKNNGHEYYLTWINKIINFLMFKTFNLQTKKMANEVIDRHYDLGNDLFESFLDPTMSYSCGYWKEAQNLEQAQLNKLELIAKKLKLKPGMRVLDIGCGWGYLCKYLAENYGVSVLGITISEEGLKKSQSRCKGLPVDIKIMDYRDLNEKFDRIVSVEMFEHVGVANYKSFFDTCNKCLNEDGILVLQTIGVNHPGFFQAEPWSHKYIFPNGILPYIADITKYSEGKFILEDWHSFGNDYCKTLKAWHDNFVDSWPKLSETRSLKFFRMWSFYLKFAYGGFKARKFQVWQITMSKDGILGGYESIR